MQQRNSWKMFNAIAGTYDRINRILSFGMDRSWRKSMLPFLPKEKTISLLDLATGTGDQLFALLGPHIASATGIDLAEGMLAHAKEKGKMSPYADRIQWALGDAAAIPYPDQSFDLATISFGIRNVEDPKKALSEMLRVLKPGGQALILEFSLPESAWLKKAYLVYLRHLLPRIGGFFSRSKSSYRYLNETIESFPSGPAFSSWMQEAGFQEASFHTMALGAVTLYRGKAPIFQQEIGATENG